MDPGPILHSSSATTRVSHPDLRPSGIAPCCLPSYQDSILFHLLWTLFGSGWVEAVQASAGEHVQDSCPGIEEDVSVWGLRYILNVHYSIVLEGTTCCRCSLVTAKLLTTFLKAKKNFMSVMDLSDRHPVSGRRVATGSERSKEEVVNLTLVG